MSETCPKCGAAMHSEEVRLTIPIWYECGTWQHPETRELKQSDFCQITELTAERDKLAADLAVAHALITRCEPEIRYAHSQTPSLRHAQDLRELIFEANDFLAKPHPGTTLLAEVEGLRRVADAARKAYPDRDHLPRCEIEDALIALDAVSENGGG